MFSWIFQIRLFVFVFCVLLVLRNAFMFTKVLYLKQGKVNTSTLNTVGTWLALSYIVTVLITGFGQ
jgi:hypothetical protein